MIHPLPHQQAFIDATEHEVLLAGDMCGKTTALLLAALEVVKKPNTTAVIYAYQQEWNFLPGGLVEFARLVTKDTDIVTDNAGHLWQSKFTGSFLAITFVMRADAAPRPYKWMYDPEFIGIDDVQHFSEEEYGNIVSKAGIVRATFNPNCHEQQSWISEHFSKTSRRVIEHIRPDVTNTGQYKFGNGEVYSPPSQPSPSSVNVFERADKLLKQLAQGYRANLAGLDEKIAAGMKTAEKLIYRFAEAGPTIAYPEVVETVQAGNTYGFIEDGSVKMDGYTPIVEPPCVCRDSSAHDADCAWMAWKRRQA